MINPETYYRDHWFDIEPERIEAYEQMFRWRPEMEPLLAPADVAANQVVLDYGCGPGWLAIELARRVGAGGRVHAADVNAEFLRRAAEHAAQEGLGDRVHFHLVKDERISLPDASLDRVICKNVLEYVTDLPGTLIALRRALRPGGLLHAIDSDWGMLVVEPLGPERIAELFSAAAMAYKTPLIGRKLFGALRAAGYSDVRVRVLGGVDTRGDLSPIIFNMARYARDSGRMEPAKIESLLDDLRGALQRGEYMLVLPQFLVTAKGARTQT